MADVSQASPISTASAGGVDPEAMLRSCCSIVLWLGYSVRATLQSGPRVFWNSVIQARGVVPRIPTCIPAKLLLTWLRKEHL